PPDRSHGAVAARGGGRGPVDPGPVRRGARGGRGDGRHVQYAARLDAHRAQDLLRDGGRWTVLPRRGAGASPLPDALGRHRLDGDPRHRVRLAGLVPGARRSLRRGDLPVLRTRRGRGVHAAATPAADVLPRPVRVVGYPVVPALFVLATLYMLGTALWQDPLHTGLAFAVIL